MSTELNWIRRELAKNPDTQTYYQLKDLETDALKHKIEVMFDQAVRRSRRYAPYSRAVQIAERIGYTEIFKGKRFYDNRKAI